MPRPDRHATEMTVAPDDLALAQRATARDGEAFRLIMKRHNQRLYRLARSIVHNDGEAEDVVQEAYARAFAHLNSYRGEASLATWLSRIVINEALERMRTARRQADFNIDDRPSHEAQIIPFPYDADSDDPERTMAQRQIVHLVERAIDNLPDEFRTVFVARVVEGLNIDETARLLGIKPETVKTRLHRARSMVRRELDAQIGPLLLDVFPFAGRRCERLTIAVMKRLGFGN
jgi:RNA polymerase sigma-70 factor (ECF subfamily)